MARNLIAALALGLFSLTVTACNTVEGAGEDLQSVSRDVDDAT
ncbi:entericidin A/B family lipoprotein [Croceicoccus estronivorus]|nr:entericidin A/B family lipoprotein [Croceicoccus estronivorus]